MGLFHKLAGGFTKNGSETAKYEYKKAKLESKEKDKQIRREEKEAKQKEKTDRAQQLIDETYSSLKYTKTNFEKISVSVRSLNSETMALVTQIESLKGANLSKNEKNKLATMEEKAEKDISYLYLIRDYFTFLTRLASGLTLKEEESNLIVKVNPYFDGVTVLDDEEKEDEDASFAGGFKEIGNEFRESLFGSRNTLGHFSLNDYLDEYYADEIRQHTLPDIERPLASFGEYLRLAEAEKIPSAEEKAAATESKPIVMGAKPIDSGVTCQKCHATVPVGAKFCPECGAKIEAQKPSFCTQCGSPLDPGAKFCPNCGAKVN
jgi:RNA polymerase subunit RPABC4/transcription elongation factor Spt4